MYSGMASLLEKNVWDNGWNMSWKGEKRKEIQRRFLTASLISNISESERESYRCVTKLFYFAVSSYSSKFTVTNFTENSLVQSFKIKNLYFFVFFWRVLLETNFSTLHLFYFSLLYKYCKELFNETYRIDIAPDIL